MTDPVCGMKVDRAKALRLERDARTHFFCSEHCRQSFEREPSAVHEEGSAEPASPAAEVLTGLVAL